MSPRAKKTEEPVQPVVYAGPTAEEIAALVRQGVKETLNPTAPVHRCGACAKLTDNTYDVCRQCVQSRRYADPNSFIASFVGYPLGTWPADLVDHLKEQLNVTFDDIKQVIDEQPEDDAKEYIIGLIRLALREPSNPYSPYYPMFDTGKMTKTKQPDGSILQEPIFEQGSVVFAPTPIDEIIWVYPRTPETPSEKKARLEAAEQTLIEHRRKQQEAHIARAEEAVRKAAEDLAKIKKEA